jgi:hypothetical protein
MQEEETFDVFYAKLSGIRNSMIGLGKKVSDVKIIRKILRSLPERFRSKVIAIEESRNLKTIRVEELVGSLQTYELTFPQTRKHKTIALKLLKRG